MVVVVVFIVVVVVGSKGRMKARVKEGLVLGRLGLQGR